MHMPEVKVRQIDTQTGASKEAGTTQLPAFSGNKRGVIPGGKYFYIADPDMYVFDAQSTKLVSAKRFLNSDVLGLGFSGDGARYVVAQGSRKFLDDNLRVWDSKTSTTIRVMETVTGRTVAAFPAPTRWVRSVALSRDGKSVAVVGRMGFLEQWVIEP